MIECIDTPVAFMVFRRPETTSKVFERIRQVKPKKLLVVADGAREDIAGEKDKCDECRRIATAVDWKCEVLTNFAETNMGCKMRMASGISWVFENVEKAIILEDDCLPSVSFFRYCQELLSKYENDNRVMMISGINHQDLNVGGYSYSFSEFSHIWGWATWKRAWQKYDVDMRLWPEYIKGDYLYRIYRCADSIQRKSFISQMQKTYDGEIDTWDYQWWFTILVNSGVSIVPERNLVRNIGLGKDGTHYTDESLSRFIDNEIAFPLRHPRITCSSDMVVETKNDNGENPLNIIKSKIKQFLRKNSQSRKM